MPVRCISTRRTLHPLRTDGFGNLVGGEDTQLVHTIAGASRETRKQVDFDLRREWNDAALDVNGGVSSEPDYLSRFVGVGGQWDFDQKLTTLNAGLELHVERHQRHAGPRRRAVHLQRVRHVELQLRVVDAAASRMPAAAARSCRRAARLGRDCGRHAGAHANAQVQANLGYTRSQGYLSNPYKLVKVAFIDPEQQFLAPSPDVLYVNVGSILEKRPDLRQQWL